MLLRVRKTADSPINFVASGLFFELNWEGKYMIC